MSDYPNFETPFLMELLVHHTKQLTELMSNNSFGKEYEDCKVAIQELQEEIELRKKFAESPNSEVKLSPSEQ